MFDQIAERLGINPTKEKQWGNFKIISSWPTERKIPGQSRILIDPNKDLVLANYLLKSREGIASNDPAKTRLDLVWRAQQYVQHTMPYNDTYYRQAIKGPDRFLGDYLTNGGTCSTKALTLHLILADQGVPSSVLGCVGIDHALVEVSDLLCIADPTWDRVAQGRPGYPIETIFKGIYGAEMGSRLQFAKPNSTRQLP